MKHRVDLKLRQMLRDYSGRKCWRYDLSRFCQRIRQRVTSHGVTDNILNWIKVILSRRSQVFRINGTNSMHAPVLSSISPGGGPGAPHPERRIHPPAHVRYEWRHAREGRWNDAPLTLSE